MQTSDPCGLQIDTFTISIAEFGENYPGEQCRKMLLLRVKRQAIVRQPLDFFAENSKARPQLIPIRDIFRLQRFHI
jgi:hypothetical protein